MKKYIILIALLATNCLASVTVKLGSPGSGSSVGSPFTIQASASSGYAITGWHAYLDGNSLYSTGSTGSISASSDIPSGNSIRKISAFIVPASPVLYPAR